MKSFATCYQSGDLSALTPALTQIIPDEYQKIRSLEGKVSQRIMRRLSECYLNVLWLAIHHD